MQRVDAARIAILGLGYVGLPLAVTFGKKYPTVGFDINEQRIAELRAGNDVTKEVDSAEFAAAQHLNVSCEIESIRNCNVYIVTVPTPIDSSRQPNLGPLIAASKTIAKVLKPGDVVIYESTVFPGATEEVCIPVIEENSGLKLNVDFFAGYSPERINPGDKARPITAIKKVTSGSTAETAEFVDALYKSVITAGTFLAASIRVAEAAKIIENTQRDVNIALMNELAMVFSHLGIDTHQVLDAAATKWNFIRLEPGLVGGHCIGVDPYYLIQRSTKAGYVPDIIRLSRELNESMPSHAAQLLAKALGRAQRVVHGAKVLVLGVTFKENCTDIRNSKVIDLVHSMRDWGMEVDLQDDWANPDEVHEEYNMTVMQQPPQQGHYDAVILAVKHQRYVDQGTQALRALMVPNGVLFDMKSVFPIEQTDLRL
jgi:UDP-N-acetyl-D-glucosamine/UDP-N-acetyl-D-galactosamine dehydrogenase